MTKVLLKTKSEFLRKNNRPGLYEKIVKESKSI